jgi:hypothetical protein
LKPVSSAEALSACLTPEILWHTSRTIVSNLRLRHLDQCSMPTVSHPTRFDTRPKCSRPCTCSDICISSFCAACKAGHSCGLTKVCLQLPDAGGATMHQPQNLATAQASHQSRELLAYTLHCKSFPYLLELGGCSLGQKACMRGLTFSTGPRVGRGTINDIPKMGWSRSRRLRGLPVVVPLLNCCMQDTNRG